MTRKVGSKLKKKKKPRSGSYPSTITENQIKGSHYTMLGVMVKIVVHDNTKCKLTTETTVMILTPVQFASRAWVLEKVKG